MLFFSCSPEGITSEVIWRGQGRPTAELLWCQEALGFALPWIEVKLIRVAEGKRSCSFWNQKLGV